MVRRPTSPVRMNLLESTDLDKSSFPEFRDRIVAVETEGVVHAPRSYPGYPRTHLPPLRARRCVALDGVLGGRRSKRGLETALFAQRKMSRILRFAHGVTASGGRGPVPSSGMLQSLELFVAILPEGQWVERGVYHYDRAGHHLSRLRDGLDRAGWETTIPSLTQFTGGAVLWFLVGDQARIEHKYGERGARFLLLEAGHLMQNLCLLSQSVRLCTLPLGGFFERSTMNVLGLPATDALLYVGACG